MPKEHMRIGAVSYLNTKPLIFGLQSSIPDCSLEFDLPSKLADRLDAEALDVALIPCVEYMRGKGGAIISDACIACRGPVRSVRVLFRTRPQDVKTLALDVGSRTSAVLSQVLLAEQFGIQPRLCPLAMHEDFTSVDVDAVLVIGDRAMNVDEAPFVTTWDLGEAWWEMTGLPFVFAMWVARPMAECLTNRLPEVAIALESARDHGLANIASIADAEHSRYGITAADCLRYFKDQLHFRLSERELAGMNRFRELAIQFGLLPSNCNSIEFQLT